MDKLTPLLQRHERPQLIESVIPSLLLCIDDIAKALRQSHHVALAGSANSFGDGQLNVDIVAENLLREALAKCPSVATASSEEDPIEKPAGSFSTQGDEQYTVAFDPLDGSSIIGPNWTVGAIVGIWDGASALNQDPATRQVASILGVFGPRTTAILAIRTPGQHDSCIELGLGDGTLELIQPEVRLQTPPFKTTYFAPANLRAAAEKPAYMNLITEFASQKYTLRYSGGLVPDVVHALVKGHGVYISPVTSTSKAKLRRLYELLPIALIIEAAGGKAIDPTTGKNTLHGPLESCDERAGLVCGNTEEVDIVRGKLIA